MVIANGRVCTLMSADRTRPRERLAFFAGFGPDETVYSAIARYGFHIGLDRPVWLNEHLLGIKQHEAIHSEMPAGLRLIAERMHRAEYRDVDYLIRHHTNFSYRAAFLPTDERDQLLRHLREDETGNMIVRGSKQGWVPRAPSLRSCRACDEEADAECRDRQWGRIHQLPLVTLCTKHCLPLLDGPSLVRCRIKYIRAGAQPPSEQPDTNSWSERETHARRWFAESSSILLNQGPSDRQIQLSQKPSELFREKGYDAGWGIDRKAILDQGAQILLDLRGLLPQLAGNERAVKRWLTAVPTSGSARPEDVLLLEYLLNQVPQGKRPSRPTPEMLFGPPPYQCRNPVADHVGQRLAIIVGEPSRLRNGRIAQFRCMCGHEYRMSVNNDGTSNPARTVALGPSLRRFVVNAQKEGVDIKTAAAKIAVSPLMLFDLTARENALASWEKPPTRIRDRRRRK